MDLLESLNILPTHNHLRVDSGHVINPQFQHSTDNFIHGNHMYYNNSELNSPTNLRVEQEHVQIPETTSNTYSTSFSTQSFDELPLRLPLWGIVALVVSYALVFILGIVGNCCVLFVVVRLKRMRTVTNYFIFNLAAADLLVLLFCLLPNLVSNIFIPWVLGWLACKLVPYIQGVSVCASIYFLVAISVERCVSIQWPFEYQITKERAKRIILAIWLWSCVVALPWSLFFQSGAFDPENPQLEFCIEVWPKSYEDWSTYYFIIGNLFICYIFPLIVILFCYFTIWLRVYNRKVPSDSYHQAMEVIYQKSRIGVLKTFIIVVLIFAISWFPLYAIFVRVRIFGEQMSDLELLVISCLYPIAQFLGNLNSSINPIIYSFLHKKFRRAFIHIIWGDKRKNRMKYKHKSPTVNILLKRFSMYRVETTMSINNYDSCDSI